MKTEKDTYQKAIAFFLGFISFVILIFIMMELSSVIIPLTFSVFLTFLFHPLVNYLKKYKIPRFVSIVFVMILLFGASYLFFILLMTSLNGIPGKADFYSERLVDFVETVLTPFNLTFNELLKLFNVSVDEVETKSVIQTLFSSGLLQKTFLSISSFLGDVLVTIIFWLFMIYGKNHFDEKVKIAFDKSGSNISDTIIKVDEQIQSYLFIKTILSLATGVIATIIMIIFDVDFPFLWGLLTFTLNYIPNVGSLIATIFPIIITLLKFGFGVHSIALSALLVANQFLIGNFIEPYFLSRKMNLSAVFVLISLIFWGWVWGIAGMFLAVPIAAIMKIVFENIEALKTFSILMGSKAGSYE